MTTLEDLTARTPGDARDYLIDKMGRAESWAELNEAEDDARHIITTDLLIALDRAVHMSDTQGMALVKQGLTTFDTQRARIRGVHDTAAARLRAGATA